MKIPRTIRNVGLLSTCQALNSTAMSITILAAPLAGYMLADDKTLATLPVAVQWIATMVTAFPASLFMKQVGRRLGFMTGCALLATGAFVSILALIYSEFHYLWIGCAVIGSGNGFAIFYRFAAVDAADEKYRSRAISYVLAGGVVAGLIGPEVAKATRDLLEPLVFAGCYAAVIGVAVVNSLVLSRLDLPRPTRDERQARGRPLAEIASQPRYLIALCSAMVGWGCMVFLMSATPLAMLACNHSFAATALVIQWHLVGMYAPSFVTGHLISRFGLPNIMLAGVALQVCAAAINISGIEVWNFWTANFILGIGWNFLFVGGTTLLTSTYTPAERARAQGLNDMLVFAVAALASFASGALHHLIGWQMVNLAVIPLVLLVLAANLWLRVQPAPAAAE